MTWLIVWDRYEAVRFGLAALLLALLHTAHQLAR